MFGIIEKWIAIPGHENYEASTLGRVRSLDRVLEFEGRWGLTRLRHRGTILKPRLHTQGYVRVTMDGNEEDFIHRIIALTFHGPQPSKKHEVAHRDGDKKNNVPANVRWALPVENAKDKQAHGTSGKGEKNSQALLTDQIVRDIITRYADGESIAGLKIAYGYSETNIRNVALGRTWSHVECADRARAKQKAIENWQRSVQKKAA